MNHSCQPPFDRRLRRRSRFFRGHRRAVAAVETAVMLPLLVFVTFGAIELANLIFLRQSVAIASYEGARAATKPGGSEASGQERVDQVLSTRGVTNYTIQFSPNITNQTARGTMVRVTVRANKSNLSYTPFTLFGGSQIANSTTMVRQ